MTEPLPAKFSSTVYHEKSTRKYKAPHGPPTRPSAQSEAVPPSVPAVPATGSAQASWVGRSAASAHLGRASHPPPSSGREQRTSAATRAEAEVTAGTAGTEGETPSGRASGAFADHAAHGIFS